MGDKDYKTIRNWLAYRAFQANNELSRLPNDGVWDGKVRTERETRDLWSLRNNLLDLIDGLDFEQEVEEHRKQYPVPSYPTNDSNRFLRTAQVIVPIRDTQYETPDKRAGYWLDKPAKKKLGKKFKGSPFIAHESQPKEAAI